MRAHRFVIVFVFLCASAAAQTAQEMVHVDPNTEVPFTLERRRVNRPLPFDVPFFLVTPVDAATKKGLAKLDDSGKGDCAKTNELKPVPVPFPGTGTDASKTFLEFRIPRLDVDKDYCLAFDVERERTPAERDKFIALLRPLLLNFYRRANLQQVATASIDGTFQQQILDIVKIAVAPAKVVKENAALSVDEMNDAEKAALAQNRDPRLAEARDLQMRQLTELPLKLHAQMRAHVKVYVDRRGANTTLPADPTDEQVAQEIERINGEIAAAGGPETAAGLPLNVAAASLLAARDKMADRNMAIDAVASEIDKAILNHYDVLATTTSGFEGRFHWYVSADMGMAVAPEIDDVFPYIGMNVGFRPINKKAQLQGLDFWRRFGLTVGLSGEKLPATGNITGLVQERAVLLGAGFRIHDHIRLSVGAEVFNEDDPDPLVTETSLAVTPYYGLSVDVDIAGIIRGFFSGLPNQ